MKKISTLLIVILFFSSCEEVIDLDLDTAPPRLVVEASINWVKGTDGKTQEIKLTSTTSFFDTIIPPVNNATVFITDKNGNKVDFIEDGKSGVYRTDNFTPQLNESYALTVVSEGETYTAEETLLPVSDITHVTQETEELISHKSIELKAFFNDPADEQNYYFYKFDTKFEDDKINVLEDKFTNGNEMFATYISDDLFQVNDTVYISLHGVSKRYYTYISTLLEQTGEGNSFFETQPATVRGNILNTTNPDNFPFGYFRLSETDIFTYTIE